MRIESARVAGKYEISVQALYRLRDLGDAAKARLTTLLIDQRNQGVTEPVVTTNLAERALNSRPLSASERAERLLRYIASCSKYAGDAVTFNWLSSDITDTFEGAMAWSESTTVEEVHYFLDYLVENMRLSNLKQFRYRVTVEGYSLIADLNANIDSAQAFVAMWFGEEMADIYENGIKPAIEQAKYRPIRIDKKDDVVKIDDEIIAEIRRSRFLVADSTHGKDGARGGVYFEAGFAFGIGIPVIYTCREDMVEKIHFDTRQYHHTVWTKPDVLRESLRNRIIALLGEGPLRTGSANV